MKLTRRNLATVAAVPLLPSFAMATNTLHESFPSQPPEIVREMVSVSHGNVKRAKELVKMHPSLAKAAWDWGFGDWETALGAASHVGNREIAEFLIEQGAPPTIFSATMLGQLELVKAFLTAHPGLQRQRGPHSITMLAHAKFGGKQAEAVLAYLESIGGAGADAVPALTDEEKEELKGTYVFGPAATEQIEIAITRGGLTFLRKGAVARPLTPVSKNEFYPAGASAVRIRFQKSADTMMLTVHDPDVIVTGKKL